MQLKTLNQFEAAQFGLQCEGELFDHVWFPCTLRNLIVTNAAATPVQIYLGLWDRHSEKMAPFYWLDDSSQFLFW